MQGIYLIMNVEDGWNMYYMNKIFKKDKNIIFVCA